MQRSVSLPRAAAVAAAVLFAGAVAGFGAAFPVFSNLVHPIALLGASGMPRAPAFNAIAFVVPGVLAAYAAYARRGALDGTPLIARLGAVICAIAGLAFAGLGLSPLDSSDLYAASSRLHAALWTAWWVAFAAGGALLAGGLWRTPLRGMAVAVAICALHVLAFALLLPGVLPVGLAQRVAFAAWLAGTIRLAPSRAAASARGSSPTGRG